MPKWLVYSIVSVFFWGLWGVISKMASSVMSPHVNQLLQTLGLVPVALLVLLFVREHKGGDRRRGAAYGFATGLLGGAGNIAYYAALSSGGKASVVTPLTALYPLITAVAAVFLLQERLNRVQVAGIVLALMAVVGLSGGVSDLFSVQKGSMFSAQKGMLLSLWMTYSLVTLALWGFTGVTQKVSSNHVSAELSYLCFALAFLPIAGAILLYFETGFFGAQPLNWNIPTKDWIIAIAGGALLGAGTLTSFVAYRSGGKASVVTTLAALYPVVTIVMAVFLLKERLGQLESFSIAAALAGGVALAHEGKPKSEEATIEQPKDDHE